MITINEYPVFEADQVLTADHLNQLFDYLDEQNRLTRTCLIGIGIVCGLDSYYDTGKINITAGVGVTSLGYLIHFDGGNYNYAREYSLPDSVSADEKTFYGGMEMWQLITPDTDNPLTVDDRILTDTGFLQDKVVILLLELDIENLKNCTTNDCDDKGSRAELNVRPLLVNANDLSEFPYTGFETNKAALPDIVLKRYNVPFKELKSPTDVLNAFYSITDATSLSNIANGYSKAYDAFKTLLPNENFNPFANLVVTLNNQLTDTKTNKYIFTEYYYGYIDDLIKAYNEFRQKGDTLLVACCPDENMFPYHLALCEALGDSRSAASIHRNYFIHSLVFGEQKALAGEVQQLFVRMKLLVQNFKLPDVKSVIDAVVRITPSEYGEAYLSERAIPYYYNVTALLDIWNYDKTRKGKANRNLSYYAGSYSNDDTVANPLLYELEPYNFFRIEGHIGKNINAAMANVLGSKQKLSLPFDVIALNVAANSRIINQNLSKCYFSDLESLYNVLTAELLCKLHEPVCFLSRLPYIDLRQYIAGSALGMKTGTDFNNLRSADTSNLSGAPAGNTSSTAGGTQGTYTTNSNFFFASSGLRSITDLQATMKAATSRTAITALTGMYTSQSQSFIDQMKYVHPYKKGTFLRHFCDPKPIGNYKTVGQYYLETVSQAGAAFPKPIDITSSGILDIYTLMNYMYSHVFYFIDCVEELMGTILPFYLYNINYNAFEYRYKLLVDEATGFATTMLFVIAFMEEQNQDQTSIGDFIEDAMIDLVIDEMEMITHLCIDEQVRTLLDEYQKRLKQISIERLFANYTKSHSGIDHKAGVPRGGTFILVYEERMYSRFTNEASTRFVVEVPQPQAIEKTAADNQISGAPTSQANDPNCAEQFLELNKYKLTTEEYTAFYGLLGKLGTTEGKPVDTFTVTQNIVFADFFLPYMCCSDCAPISYILQEVIDEEPPPPPTISTQPNIICSNDPGFVTLSVTPSGGKFNLSAVTKINDTTFQVAAKDLAVGDNTITYEVNAQTVLTTVTVLKAPDAAFTFTTDEFNAGTIHFTSTDQEAGLQHKWDFGDANTSTEINPAHQYTVDGTQTFIVAHFVESQNKCSAQTTLPVTITVQKASVQVSPNPVCRNSQDLITITVNPAGGQLSIAAAKINDFTYQILVAAFQLGPNVISYTVNGETVSTDPPLLVNLEPNAFFNAQQIFSVPGEVDFTGVADASSSHEWDFGDPNSGADNKSIEANPKHIYNVSGASQDFNVIHRVTDKNGCFSSTSEKVTVKGKEIVPEARTFCFSKEIPLEPNAQAGSSLLNGDVLKGLFDKYKFNITDNLVMAFEADPNEIVTFEADYIVNDGTTQTEKHVTVTIIGVNSHFNIQANKQNNSVVFTVAATQFDTLKWTINFGQRAPIIKTDKQFEISQDTFSNLEIMHIILDVTIKQNGTVCGETNKADIVRTDFLKILDTSGGRDF